MYSVSIGSGLLRNWKKRTEINKLVFTNMIGLAGKMAREKSGRNENFEADEMNLFVEII